MKVIQLLTTVSYGDAVSNDALALYDTLLRAGYDTAIYAENIGKRVSRDIVKPVGRLPLLNETDVVIYHLSTGTSLNYLLPSIKAKKIVRYHNITPPEYFEKYDLNARRLCKDGYDGLKYIAPYADYCLADSEYNKFGLIENGYKCDVDILPILIPFDDYKKTPNSEVIEKYKNDGYTNVLFTGRIAPNKKQEDVIKVFAYYQKYYNEKSRLILVGNYVGMERYYKRLLRYTKELDVKNVIFPGHIGFDEILAYYKLADVFLCMSEHEGFCVPLVEAMWFDVPVVAYDSSAIAGTLGGAGILLPKNEPLEAAAVVNYVLTHNGIREKVIRNQRERLSDFEHNKIEQQFLTYLKGFINR